MPFETASEILEHPFCQGIITTAKTLDQHPYCVIAQPRRTKSWQPVQNVWEPNIHLQFPFALKFQYATVDGLPVDVARNKLFQHALNEKAKYILFIDDDTMLPWNAISRLLWVASTGKPIVTGVYCSKGEINTLAANWDKTTGWITPINESDIGVIEINWIVGMGCMLIDLNAVRTIVQQIPEIPLAFMPYNPTEKKPHFGEDFYFVQRAINAGIPVHMDTTIRCLHVDVNTGNYWCPESTIVDENIYRGNYKLAHRNTIVPAIKQSDKVITETVNNVDAPHLE